MKNFLKQITHDPYVDWLLIVVIGAIGIVAVSLWSIVKYQSATHLEQGDAQATTTSIVRVDGNRVDALVKYFKERTPSLIDVRDPSL